jgi:hypothetical protein
MASIIKIAAACSFLSPLCILAGVPVAASLGGVGGPGPIDFGSGVVLTQLAMAAPRTIWVDTLALVSPVLALPVGAGWYLMLDHQRPLAALGTLLWYLGMVFVIAQDALQLAVVSTLPSAYVAADPPIKPALEVFGNSVALVIEVLAAVGVASGAGFMLLSLAMLRSPRIPRWIAILGLAANAAAILSTGARFLVPNVEILRLGVPLGILAFVVVCIPALGVVMLRWKPGR